MEIVKGSDKKESKLPVQCCKKCLFYGSKPPHEGQCLRNPPQVQALVFPAQIQGSGPNVSINSFFPPVHEAMWCGEFSFSVDT